MRRLFPCFFLVVAACNGGAGRPDASADVLDAEGEDAAGEAADADDGEALHDAEEEDARGEDGRDSAEDAGPDRERYDGEVPPIAPFSKEDHVTSCMITRACSPENPQQLATCTSAYAHIVGREIGITLGWVAGCVIEAAADCASVRACMGGGSEPEPCMPLETPDRCEGSVLYQCSRASALTFTFDCANVGMDCYIDDERYARCGLGECESRYLRPGCFDDTLVFCEEGVITVADCGAAGLVCVETEEEPGRCAGAGEPCDEETEGRSCEGDILTGCLGGRRGVVDCSEVIEGWTCGPSEGTLGCVPPGDECWAYPLIGSSIEEDCEGDDVVTCLDGYVTRLSCADYELGPCTDLGTAARCTPP